LPSGDVNGASHSWFEDEEVRTEGQAQSAALDQDVQSPRSPSWTQQSTLWRQRRQALALSLSQAQKESIPAVNKSESQAAPEIKFSRYITPLGIHGQGSTTDLQGMGDAEKYAQSYSDLIVSDGAFRAETPDNGRADSIVSTATFVTMSSDNKPSKITVPRAGSAMSTYSTATTTTATSWSENGLEPGVKSSRHSRAKSAHVRAFRPTDAIYAERSRALSLAKHGSFTMSQENLSVPVRPQNTSRDSSDSLFDRYSGGLHFGWNKEDGGFGGSAGTVVTQARRKGAQVREDLGLDLSDIPVFLQRSSFTRAG